MDRKLTVIFCEQTGYAVADGKAIEEAADRIAKFLAGGDDHVIVGTITMFDAYRHALAKGVLDNNPIPMDFWVGDKHAPLVNQGSSINWPTGQITMDKQLGEIVKMHSTIYKRFKEQKDGNAADRV